MSFTGVDGLIETAAFTPAALICSSVRSRSSHASACTVMESAPHSTKSRIYLSGSVTIKCTSKNMLDSFRIDLITGIPKEMLGTKSPSITSICRYSTPSFSRILICSPSLLKSADKIDGHNRYSMTQYLLFSFNSWCSSR